MRHRTDDNQSELFTHEGGGDCPSFEMLSAFFDQALDAGEYASVGRHVSACQSCQSVLADLSLLRSSLRISSPAVGTRSFAITDSDSGEQNPIVTKLARKPRTFPIFPIAAAVAAILLLALIAGERFSENDEQSPTESPAQQVLIIDGTAFTDDEDDAQFGAASAGSMNESNDDESTQEPAVSEESFWSAWRIAQVFALVAAIAAVGIWAGQRRRDRHE